jgi:hypothetical protein
MGKADPDLHQIRSFRISNFKGQGYGIRKFNFTATKLTLSNPIFLLTAYSPAVICFEW